MTQPAFVNDFKQAKRDDPHEPGKEPLDEKQWRQDKTNSTTSSLP
jgi:hypothetical protein